MKTTRLLTESDKDQVLEIHRAHTKIMRTNAEKLSFDYKAIIEENFTTRYFNNNFPKFLLYGTFEGDNLLCYMAVQKVPEIASWILNYIKVRPGVSNTFNVHKNGLYELFEQVLAVMELDEYFKVYYTRSVSNWPTKRNGKSFDGLPFVTRYIRNVEHYVPANTLPREEFSMFRGMLANVMWPNDIVILSRTLKEEFKPYPKVDE